MNWKTSLDRYLTTPPDDGSEEYCFTVWDKYTNDITDDKWEENTELFEKWTDKCFDKGLSPEQAGKLIERAYSIYKKN